jgi:hypothetical protein
MKEIPAIIDELIPPSDYQHRNGFSNDHIIDSLSTEQKRLVETQLLGMLEQSDDWLIGETLTYMNSTKAIDLINSKLNSSTDPTSRITWAGMINNLKKGDVRMKEIAYEEFLKLSDKYQLISFFHTLRLFDLPNINERIKSYIDHKDYLIAYNARTALGLDVTELIKQEQQKDKL